MVSSPDSRDAPAIRLNTLTVADDVAAFIRAIRRAREIVSTEPFAPALTVEVHPVPSVNTDAELQTWIRGTVATTGHPGCCAPAGRRRLRTAAHPARGLHTRGVWITFVTCQFVLPHVKMRARVVSLPHVIVRAWGLGPGWRVGTCWWSFCEAVRSGPGSGAGWRRG
jgi:GMC oxidoreductase